MIVNISQLRLRDASTFGGKAASLGEMHARGIPVPEGLAIPAQAYREYTHSIGIDRDIARFWNTQDTRTAASELSLKIKARLQSCAPVDLSADILHQFGAEALAKLIVRSSCTAEDLVSATFAGQFLSLTCRPFVQDLAKSLSEVWASATTPNVKSYLQGIRGLAGLPLIDMGVLVQKYVRCDVSGLLFTHHPTVPLRGWALLEFSAGGVEALVSGKTVPSRWRVNLVDKRTVIENSSDMGSAMPPAPKDLATIIEYASRLRGPFAGEVDIEWGISSGRVFFFQCRPITVLPKDTNA